MTKQVISQERSMRKPRILIVTEVFYPEEFLINDIALSWKDKGFEVSVITLTPTYPLGRVFKGYKNKIFYKDSYKGINIFRARAVTGYRESKNKKFLRYINFMIFGGFIATFIGRRFDYIFGYNLGPLTDMVPAVIIHKLYKKPLMFWVQDLWPDTLYAYGFKKTKILSGLLDSFIKFMYHNVSSIAISCKGFEPKLKPYVKKNLKMAYLPNWNFDIDMDVEAAKLSTTPKVNFTFAGNVGKVQNLENIVDAFSLLSSEYQQKAQFNIIGDGSNLENIKKGANNNPHVIFYGRQDSKDMAKFYKASDFLIISLIENPVFSVTVPCKMQTYIAAKKPILAVINGDVADIVNDNSLGVSVDPSNVSLIKEAFEKCIDMPENEKSKFIINNAKLLETTFNKDFIISKLTENLIR
jgi:glycosyltransferase involved in cell wall biosynthesis